MLSSDNAELAGTVPAGGAVLEFDFPAFRVGVAEYAEGPTGCSVFHFGGPVATFVDARGGAVGATGNHQWNHAICLAGGSSYGTPSPPPRSTPRPSTSSPSAPRPPKPPGTPSSASSR